MKQALVLATLAMAIAANNTGWAQNREIPGLSGKPSAANSATKAPSTLSSFDVSGGTNTIPAGGINFNEADIQQVFELYENISGRTLIRSPQVPMAIKITLRNQSPLTAIETLRVLDDIFAANGIAMVQLGTLYVKAVPVAAVNTEPTPVIELPWQQLPLSSSPLTYIVKLKHAFPDQVVSMLQPFARLPNSIIAMRDNQIIIFRDYSGNVRRMLEVLEKIDQPATSPAPGAPPRQ
jgi:type II secretory pathway component GspD/PulD (secretin)